ncbi:Formate hydrogenlyase subunit 5 precursor [Actinomadura rubteroloni]|uniref:Formate hydrogenlyase subunit 5 n=2 Tax=Actinomadura rubteroloni TaxID=1926885 RepID=A0A2P4UFH5_9ACTN|nr:Formate hydrogenlyase subunit 5 precursor [Actinomadura rubteroloni]
MSASAVPPRASVADVEAADLAERAAALLDDGHRLALVAAAPQRVVYLFTRPAADGEPERRAELHVRPGVVPPSLAALSLPAGRFERRAGRDGRAELFHGRLPADALPLAERVGADAAVGHALAFCLAVEDAAGVGVSPGVQRSRAVLLELERLGNHVADLGALCDEAGRPVLGARFARVRETLLRLNVRVTGHRLLRGGVLLGGAVLRAVPDPRLLAAIEADVEEIADLALADTAVAGRFTGTAPLGRAAARDLGALGCVARASGLDVDARRDHPFTDLRPTLAVATALHGDVLARFRIRVREIAASVALVDDLTYGMNPGLTSYWPPLAPGHGPASGIGIVEGWRGTIVHRVELAADGALVRDTIVDPSFFNRPALPVALAGALAADVLLVTRSFNLS